MRRSYDYAPNQEHGWSTTSQDYHSHITKIERMPSVLNETPQYPSVHKIFKNRYASGEENETLQEQPQKKTSPKSKKKVQMSEHVEIVESHLGDETSEVQETSVDAEADGFIKQKRKGFELCKWKTFKLLAEIDRISTQLHRNYWGYWNPLHESCGSANCNELHWRLTVD